MFFTKAFCVIVLFLIYANFSIADRPNYLTEEDFAKARLISSATNGTIFNLPRYDKNHPVRNEE